MTAEQIDGTARRCRRARHRASARRQNAEPTAQTLNARTNRRERGLECGKTAHRARHLLIEARKRVFHVGGHRTQRCVRARAMIADLLDLLGGLAESLLSALGSVVELALKILELANDLLHLRREIV